MASERKEKVSQLKCGRNCGDVNVNIGAPRIVSNDQDIGGIRKIRGIYTLKTARILREILD